MDVATYSLLNKKIKGLTSGIQGASISGTTITFTMADGSKEVMTFPTPADGVSITDVNVNTDKHLIVTLSDGSTVDAGLVPTVKGDKGEQGEKGDTGFSPTITENPDNTNEIYKLDVTNEDGTFTTPNLKGTGGGLDPDKYYDKTQINALVEPLNEAKHAHDNKEAVLDKLTTNDTGDTLLFNGNAIKGSVEIDDITTTAIDKVWSAKKTNDTFEEVKQSVTDTNAKFADYDTSAEVDGKITTALTGYEKTEDVDNKLAEYDKSTVVDKKITDALADYDTSEVVYNKLKDYAKTTEVNTKLADYYKKTETYSNAEVDDKFTDFKTTLTNAIKTWVDSEESLALKTTLYYNNTLTFYKKPNATVDDTADFSINLPEEQFLDQTKTTFVNNFAWSEELYPNSTNPNLDNQPVLVLAVKGDTDVAYSFVSMNELVKIYKASTIASTVTLTIDDATNTISAEVNISADEGNLLEVGTDGGLYAKATNITGKADKLTDIDVKENQILLDDGNGNIKASDKDISDYIPAWSGTKAQWETLDKTTLADGAVVNITDDFVENPVQVKAMPDTATEGDVVQYIGFSTTDYTHGYFYEYAVNETGILSWKYLPVDAVYKNNNSYSMPIGSIIPFSGNTIPVGFLVCDGQAVSKTKYVELYKIVGNLYGESGSEDTFLLPDLRDRFVQGANGNLGTSKNAGLPNITGKFYHDTNVKKTLEGAFSYTDGSSLNLANSATSTSGYVTFDASKSNPIYGNSDTVQPPSVCLNYIIKAEKVDDQYAAEVSALIDDTSVSANKVWSSEKVNNSTVPYILIDTTKDIDFDEYIETGYYTPNKSFSTGWFTHSILNAPTEGWLPAGGFGLEIKTFDNTSTSKWFTQILYSYVGTDNNSAPIYSRTFFYDGTKTKFSPWKRIADIDDSIISSEETWSSQKINKEHIKVHKKNTSVTTAVYQWFVARYDPQTKQISITIPITIADDVSNVSLDFGNKKILLHTGSGEVEQTPTQVSVIGIEDSKSLGLLRFDMTVDSGDTSINCIAIPDGTTITFS